MFVHVQLLCLYVSADNVAEVGEDERYIELAQSEEAIEDSGTPRMRQIESARAQWRQKEQLRLEESWTSLNLFERSHKGRLSIDMEGVYYSTCIIH